MAGRGGINSSNLGAFLVKQATQNDIMRERVYTELRTRNGLISATPAELEKMFGPGGIADPVGDKMLAAARHMIEARNALLRASLELMP